MTTSDSSNKSSHGHHDEQLPEEPKTPFWLTALGVALLVGGGLGYLLVHEPTPESEAEAKAEAEAKPQTASVQTAAQPRGMPPGTQPSAGRPKPLIRKLKHLRIRKSAD